MPSLEQRNGRFRIVFRFGGQKLSRSLKTKDEDDALGTFARLQDNLRRAELGHLAVPEGADVAAFLLSDGRATARPTLPKMRTLKQLLDAYMGSLPDGAIEESTRQGMDIHIAHLLRVLGDGLVVGTDYGREACPRSEYAPTPRAKSSILGCYRDRMAVCLREFDRDGSIHEQ